MKQDGGWAGGQNHSHKAKAGEPPFSSPFSAQTLLRTLTLLQFQMAAAPLTVTQMGEQTERGPAIQSDGALGDHSIARQKLASD